MMNVKSSLFTALENELKIKKMNEISITNLCQDAHIYRSSFYRNFDSILDLYSEYKNTIISKMEEEVYKSSDSIRSLIVFFKNNYLPLSIITYYMSEEEKKEKFAFLVKQVDNRANKEFYVSFIIGGVISSLLYWAKTDFHKTVDEMDCILKSLINKHFL